jgi:calcineurin-like phosphoesterase
MNHKVNNPFSVVEKILEKYKNDKLDWIIIDFHKEASSEFYWLANYLDGKISFIFGTHTHVQTNDDVIFPNWTGIISDVGMTWPLYSVIWADFETVKGRFLYWINRWKIEQSLSKEYVVSWVFVEIWKKWKCEKIEKIRIIEK